MQQLDGQHEIRVRFLSEGEQSSLDIARDLVSFIAAAHSTLDIAIYDFRLSDTLKAMIVAALHERAQAGVAIRIAYDADKPAFPRPDVGMDPAPSGTGSFVQSLGYPWRRIDSSKLMHNK